MTQPSTGRRETRTAEERTMFETPQVQPAHAERRRKAKAAANRRDRRAGRQRGWADPE